MGLTIHGSKYKKSMARLKEAAMASDDCPAKLLNKELKELLPKEFRGYWPNESSTKRAIQRHRRKFLPAIPKSLDEIQLDEQWQQSSRGEQWLLCDRMDGSDRLIIFCTERCLTYLYNSDVWYGDGTFSVAPTFFYQLYTIHGVVMGQLVPLAYCILTRKTKSIYEQMFLAISDSAVMKGIRVSVSKFRVDFEDACIKAFETVFPEATVEACFFHLAQAHWRKLGDLGMRPQYIADEEFAIAMRMYTALAFVPPSDVIDVFAELCEGIQSTTHGFIPYMEETYVGRYTHKFKRNPDGTAPINSLSHLGDNTSLTPPRFSPTLWSVYQRTLDGEPRTNNHLEGWHRRFKAIVDRHHPNIYVFLEQLRGEQAHTETVLERLIAGTKPVEPRKKVKKCNERLFDLVQKYSTRSNLDYLKGIAYNFAY